MKKNYLILASGLLFLFGCTTQNWDTQTGTWATSSIDQTTIKWQNYDNKQDGFSIQFPGNRTFQENVYGSSIIFFTPVLTWDNLKENVGIIKKTLDKDYSLDEYYSITKSELIKLIPWFTEISNESLKINDIDAKKLIYTGTQSNSILKWEQIYLIKNKAVYIITYTATDATFDDFATKVDEMATTLELQ